MRIANNNNWRERLEEHMQKSSANADYDAIWEKIQAGRGKEKPAKKRAMWMYYAAAILTCILFISILTNDSGTPKRDTKAAIKKTQPPHNIVKANSVNESTIHPINQSTNQPINPSSTQPNKNIQTTKVRPRTQPLPQPHPQPQNQPENIALTNPEPPAQPQPQPSYPAGQKTTPGHLAQLQPQPLAKTKFTTIHINQLLPPAPDRPAIYANELRLRIIRAREGMAYGSDEQNERIVYKKLKDLN